MIFFVSVTLTGTIVFLKEGGIGCRLYQIYTRSEIFHHIIHEYKVTCLIAVLSRKKSYIGWSGIWPVLLDLFISQ
jgi:hypothetical protein